MPLEALLFVPELDVVLKCEELKDGMDDRDDESEGKQVDVCLQECFLDAVLILVILFLSHQVTKHVKPEQQRDGG